MKLNRSIYSFVYVATSFILTFFFYYAFAGLLGQIGTGNILTSIFSVMTMLSPILGSVLGAWTFLFLFHKEIDHSFLWKTTILYCFVFSLLLEWYFAYYENMWTGLGLIVGVVNGAVLVFFAVLQRVRK